MIGDDVGECAFPNMESIAMLNKNSYKMGGKKERKIGDCW